MPAVIVVPFTANVTATCYNTFMKIVSLDGKQLKITCIYFDHSYDLETGEAASLNFFALHDEHYERMIESLQRSQSPVSIKASFFYGQIDARGVVVGADIISGASLSEDDLLDVHIKIMPPPKTERNIDE